MCGGVRCVCFFKQKTAYEWRISDWSSAVCSSDLHSGLARLAGIAELSAVRGAQRLPDRDGSAVVDRLAAYGHPDRHRCCRLAGTGRAKTQLDRKSVV